MGGLIRTMPVTAVAFLLCSFSVMGIPPLGGFFSKYLVIAGAANSGHLWITAAFVITAFLTIIYLMRTFVLVFMGKSITAPVREASPVMVASVAVLALLSVIGGLWIGPSLQFAQAAAQQMLGH